MLKLNIRQLKFVENYIATGSALQSAINAGYSKRYAENATKFLLENIGIKKEIERRTQQTLKKRKMDADELLNKFADWARIDLTKYIITRQIKARNDDGVLEVINQITDLDIEAMKKDGVASLIKSIKQTRNGTVFEFNDPMRAAEILAKHLGLFVEDKNQINVEVKPVVKIYVPDNGRSRND